MKILTSACVLLLLSACGENRPPEGVVMTSDINADEVVAFFNTSAWLDESKQEWHLPIHGVIYEPEDSTVRKATFARILESQYDLIVDEDSKENFSQRINFLMADNERGKTIVVNIASREFPLAESRENGQFRSTIVLPVAQIERYAPDGYLRYSTVSGGNESRTFSGTIQLLEPSGVSIISDIDDTVKISNVGDHRSLLEQTFLRNFVAVPGMADWFSEWAGDDIAFHYVSSSPWQLYQPLSEFLSESNFPWATYSLKSVRFRDETLFDLFKKGTETKPAAIKEILDHYPGRTFILVGDSGEQDPEVYAALLRERPEQIRKVYIRNVSQESIENSRFKAVFAGIDAQRWQLFENAPSH